MEELKRMEVGEFVRRFKHDIVDIDDSKFVFFIGSGCSASSGIPCAKDLASIWLRRLMILKKGNDDNFEEWVKKQYSDYAPESAALYYGRVIQELFLRPEARQREIEQLTEGKDPGFGYAVLAKMMSHERYGSHCNAVLTVNFDDLIADALYLYTRKKPLVIVHDSLVGFVRNTRKKPLVLKLHGDARLEPKNTESETSALADSVKKILKNFLSETGLIFIGYGGHDESIAEILSELPKEALPWGVFWINKEVPEGSIGKWLKERNAIWVDHTDFDELMLLILTEFELSHPEESRFIKLMDAYRSTFKNLSQRLDRAPDSEIKNILSSSLDKAISEAPLWGFLVEAERNWEKDPDKAERIYTDLMSKYPNNADVLGSYGAFLHCSRRNYDKSEEYFKSALQINPDNVGALNGYALLLKNIRKKPKEAEEYLRKALEISPNEYRILNNYATLQITLKDYEKAEYFFNKSLEINPDAANTLGNYGGFLLGRGNKRGLDFLKRAQEIAEKENINNLLLEILFYYFAHGQGGSRLEAFKEIENLLEKGIRSPGWDFSINIEKATKDGHPYPDLLYELSRVISDEIDLKSLDRFETLLKE